MRNWHNHFNIDVRTVRNKGNVLDLCICLYNKWARFLSKTLFSITFSLTHLFPVHSSSTSWKHQKTVRDFFLDDILIMAASLEKCLVPQVFSCINSNCSSANTTAIPCNVTMVNFRDIY